MANEDKQPRLTKPNGLLKRLQDKIEKSMHNKELLGTFIAAPVNFFGGAIVGYFQSLYDPFFIKKGAEKINHGKIKDLVDFSLYDGALAGYILGIYLIAKEIVQDPSINSPKDLVSYIPVAAHIISGAIQLSYKYGCKKNSEERLSEVELK